MRRDVGDIELQAFVQPSQGLKESWKLKRNELTKRKINRKLLLCILVVVLVTTTVFGVIKIIMSSSSHRHSKPQTRDDYTSALHTTLRFFDAQISGKLPKEANVSWRGDSCLRDGIFPGSPYPHLAGGYYDGGDAVKSNFPMSFAMTLMSWSVIEYGSKYQTVGELKNLKRLIKQGTDYLLNTFDITDDTVYEMVSQIGTNDYSCWIRPEDIDYHRRVTSCFAACPHIAAEMGAALASASIVFLDNKEYSATLLHSAKAIYRFAETMSRKLDKSSSYWDELLWGGVWMYYATGDPKYLEKVTDHNLADRAGAFSTGHSFRVFSWENKLVGTQLLLTRLRLFLEPPFPYEEMLHVFHRQTRDIMCSYLPNFDTFNRTKGGLILLNHGDPKPLQYAANAAFLTTLYSDYLDASNTPGWNCGPTFFSNQVLRDFSRSQIDYILGKNPQNMSYVVGFGERFPRHVHHRGASIPKNQKVSCKGGLKWKESRKENPNTIVGAMVAGPDKHDGFHDVRTNYNYTEPTLVGNAGLVAALVASSGVGGIDKNAMFVSIPP